MIRQWAAVNRRTITNRGLRGNLFENGTDPRRKGTESCEGDNVRLEKWRRSGGKSIPVTTTILVRMCTEAASTYV